MHTISHNAIFLYSDCKIVTSMKRSAIVFSPLSEQNSAPTRQSLRGFCPHQLHYSPLFSIVLNAGVFNNEVGGGRIREGRGGGGDTIH